MRDLWAKGVWRAVLYFSGVPWRAVGIYRLADRCERTGHRATAAFLATFNRIVAGVDIEPGATIGQGLIIRHGHGIVIGQAVTIGRDCEIYQQVTVGIASGPVTPENSPRIGDGVVIGAGAKILGPVTIGDHAVIGANAVVLKDVPPGGIAVGVPARVHQR